MSEEHREERRKPGRVTMCWQQKSMAALLATLGAGGVGFGVVNNNHGMANEKSIESVKIQTEVRVQSLAEQHAAVTEKIESLKRDVDRIEKGQMKMDGKLDRLIERGARGEEGK